LVKGEETNKATGMIDARDRDISRMSLGAAVSAHQKYHGTQGGRLNVWIAAGTPRGSPEEAHKAIGDACAAHGINLTMHCAEAPDDRSIYRDSYDCSAAQFCERTNLISAATEEGPKKKPRRTVLAHMVNLDLSTDLPILARTGAAVAHNPSSNCKLGSGIAAVPEMMCAGITVSLGTDGAPCANTYDMIQEMRLAALLHRGARQDAKAMAAEEVLEMVTINGAKALGLAHEVGSLEVGKMADFVVLGTGGLHCAPFDAEQILEGGLDPVTAVVFSCTGADVDKVVVDGRVLVEGGKLVACDEARIKRDAREAVRRVRTKAGVRANGTRKYC
jgi:cytosine/adenosine deaminase-related metal-dependent hydrolase